MLAARIKAHPPVSEIYAEQLVKEGVVTREEVETEAQGAPRRSCSGTLKELRRKMEAGEYEDPTSTQVGTGELDRTKSPEVETAVSEKRLRSLNEELLKVPESFTIHRKLRKPLMRRLEMLDEGPIEYGHAEALAFASLLTEGTHIRLTGQDTERGTFSHRHLALHDEKTGLKYVPIQNLSGALAPFELHNSPLSEAALPRLRVRLLGRLAREPRALGGAVRRLRQRRAGDHRQLHRLRRVEVGPDDAADPAAAARLRGLGAGALERPDRALHRSSPPRATCGSPTRRPPPSTSTCCAARRGSQAAAAGGLHAEGPAAPRGGGVEARRPHRRDVPVRARRPPRRRTARSGSSGWCSAAARSTTTWTATSGARTPTSVAIARVELLYPFAKDQIRELIASYPNLKEIVWAQEEPQNMGAWKVDDPAHARSWCPRASSSATSAAPSARAPARATRPPTAPSRSGSCSRR